MAVNIFFIFGVLNNTLMEIDSTNLKNTDIIAIIALALSVINSLYFIYWEFKKSKELKYEKFQNGIIRVRELLIQANRFERKAKNLFDEVHNRKVTIPEFIEKYEIFKSSISELYEKSKKVINTTENLYDKYQTLDKVSLKEILEHNRVNDEIYLQCNEKELQLDKMVGNYEQFCKMLSFVEKEKKDLKTSI
jgi:hypothetical protein